GTTPAVTDTTEAVTDTTEAVTDTTEAMTDTTTAAGELLTDIGVDDTTIKLGMLADLTGIFSPLVQDIVAAQQVYWDIVNANGGIAGRQIELVIEDTNYNAETHAEKYEALRGEVLALSQSTGSPYTAATVPKLIDDNMVTIALTWYSGWADPAFDGGLVFEQQTNYCFEAMNMVSWLNDKHVEETGEQPTLAILSFPGEYGEDSAVGAQMAADLLGIEVVYDGRAQVVQDPNADFTPIISQLLSTQPDWVWITTNPTIMATIFGGSVQQGPAAQWSGAVPSYDFRLLDSPIADALGQLYWQPGYNVTWGTDVPGMQELITAMTEARPDLRPSDASVIGWLEAKTMEAILLRAAENGDMTRAGMVAAGQSLEGVDYAGMAPAQSYAGEPNDYVVREISVFKPNPALYQEAGGATQTIGAAPNAGTTGSELVEEFFVSDIVANYDFQERCFAP
ncbi:MAG: ABC transporter substrate-binding protein, partial [Acidimicrobiia bacterium]